MADNVLITPGSGATIATDECVINSTTVQVQRVKVLWGVDGTGTDTSATNPLPQTAYILDPTGPTISQARAATADGANAQQVLYVADGNWNGATIDRVRGNTEGTLLVSAARTTSTQSADQINYNAKGVAVTLNLTAFTTAASLTLNIEAKDPVSGVYYTNTAAPTTVTATGLFVYSIYPGIGAASGGVTARTSGALPRTWRVNVTHGNANSHTYSVGFQLIL